MSAFEADIWKEDSLDENALDVHKTQVSPCSSKCCDCKPWEKSEAEELKYENISDDDPITESKDKDALIYKLNNTDSSSNITQEGSMGNCHSVFDSTEVSSSEVDSDSTVGNTNSDCDSTIPGTDSRGGSTISETDSQSGSTIAEIDHDCESTVPSHSESSCHTISSKDNKNDQTQDSKVDPKYCSDTDRRSCNCQCPRFCCGCYCCTCYNSCRMPREGNNKDPNQAENNQNDNASTTDNREHLSTTLGDDLEKAIAVINPALSNDSQSPTSNQSRCDAIPVENTSNDDNTIAEIKVEPQISGDNESKSQPQHSTQDNQFQRCWCYRTDRCNCCNRCYCHMCWGPRCTQSYSSSVSDDGRISGRKKRYRGEDCGQDIRNEKIQTCGENYNEDIRRSKVDIDTAGPSGNKRRKVNNGYAVKGNDGKPDRVKREENGYGYCKGMSEPQSITSTDNKNAPRPRDTTCRVCRRYDEGTDSHDSKSTNEHIQKSKTYRTDYFGTSDNRERNVPYRAQSKTNISRATQTHFDGSENDSTGPNDKATQTYRRNTSRGTSSTSEHSTLSHAFHTNEVSWTECEDSNTPRLTPKGRKRFLSPSPVMERKRHAKTPRYEGYYNNAYLNYYVRLFRQERFMGMSAPYVAKYAGVQWRKHLSQREKRPYYEMTKLAIPRGRKKRRK